MPKNKLVILLLLLFPLLCISQTGQGVPLTTLLKQVAKAHAVKFSYIDNELAPYTLIPPPQKLTLEQTLEYIEHITGLRFERTSPARYIVYQLKTANLLSPIPDVPAEPQPIQLDEVVAQRYLASGISKKEGGQLVVTPQKFGILPGMTEPDVLQTMQQLPGVTSVDETVSNINVRGGTHDQNLFLWNGIRMFQTSHFFGLISAFNPLPATTISIYKNGSPAFFGESVSSLIDISTHAQPQDSTYNAVTADMLTVNALSVMKLSHKDRLQVAARRSFTDAITTPTYKSYTERIFQNTTITDVLQNKDVPVKSSEKFYFYDVSFSYSHTLNNNHTLLVDGIGILNSLRVFQGTPLARRDDSLLQRNLGGSATLMSKWNGRATSEVQAYASGYDVKATNEAVDNEQVTHQRNTIFDKGIRLKYSNAVLPNLGISTGYQFNEISVKNFDEVNIPAYSKNTTVVSRSHAFIAEGNYTSKNGRSKVHAGLRTNYFEKYAVFLFEPRLVATQKLTHALKLELSAERKSQAVSQVIDLQQDFLGIEKRRWVLADGKDIPLQKSTQAALALNYANNGWYASVECFYKKVSGISSHSQGFQNQFEFIESTGYYTVAGLEFLLQKKFGSFYTWVSYSYNDNRYHFYGFVPPGFSNNFAIPHAVTAAGSYEWNSLRVALGARWRSGTPVTEPLSFYVDPDNPANSRITYGNPNNNRLDDNVQVNFSLAKTWRLSSRSLFTASCSILNLLDTKNNINRYYRINKSNNNIESVDTYGLKRTPNVNVKIIF
jgi:TonB-dependent Receptor Plug Domain